jgi:glycosyltransferase involved in cell wall biosynthesis
VKAIAGSRFEPLVLVPRPGPLTEELDRRKLPWIALELPPWRKGYAWKIIPSRVRDLRQLLVEKSIDLIHCNEIYPNPHAVAASSKAALWKELFCNVTLKRQFGKPRQPIVTHNRLSVTPRMTENYLLGEASRLIAVSHAAAQDFRGEPWFMQKVRVVYNGIDFEEFEQAWKRRDRTRQRLGFGRDDFVIGSIGLLMPRKRPMFLLEAAPVILQKVPSAYILFVGDPSPGQQHYADELRSFAEKLGVASRVKFLSFQERIADIFAALDLHVLISNDEGFGRVVIEAAAAGVPTIASRVGGIQELIIQNETGILIGNEQARDDKVFWYYLEDFVAAVTELAYAPQLRQRMGQAAYEHCRARFSVEQYVKGVLAVFEEALHEFETTQPPW